MNISATSLTSSSANNITEALKSLTEQLKADRMNQSPLTEDGAPNPAFIRQTMTEKSQKRLKSYMEKSEKAKSDLDSITTFKKLSQNLQSAFNATSRNFVSKTLSAENGITGTAKVSASAGIHNVNILQKAEKCKFTINPLDANKKNTYWNSAADIITDIAQSNGKITTSGGVNFVITKDGFDYDITLNANQTLDEVINKINQDMTGTGIIAKSESYMDGLRLVIESEEAGTVFTVRPLNDSVFANVSPEHDSKTSKAVRISYIDGAGAFGFDPDQPIPAGVFYDPMNFPAPPVNINGESLISIWYDTNDTARNVLTQFVESFNQNLLDRGSDVYAALIDDGKLHIEFKKVDGSSGIDLVTNLPHASEYFVHPQYMRCTKAASESIVEYNGNITKSSSNNLSSIINGATLDITNADLGMARVSVSPGKDWVSVVTNLANAYNEASDYLSQLNDEADSTGNRNITSSASFREVSNILASIQRYSQSIGGVTKSWQSFKTSFTGGKMIVDSEALKEAAKSPDFALSLQAFLTGGDNVKASTVADPGNGFINNQFSTLQKGSYVKVATGNAFSISDLNRISVTFNGLDFGNVANYNVSIFHKPNSSINPNIAVNAADPNNIILTLSGTYSGNDYEFEYHLSSNKGIETGDIDDIYTSYTRVGNNDSSSCEMSLLSYGNSIQALDKISNISFFAADGGNHDGCSIFYNGQIYNIGQDFGGDSCGTITDFGGGTYKLLFTKPGHDLENLSLEFTANPAPANSLTYVYNNPVLGTGIGASGLKTTISALDSNITNSEKLFKRQYNNSISRLDTKIESENRIIEQKVAAARLAAIIIRMNDISKMIQSMMGLG